jgi:hypothetical protein
MRQHPYFTRAWIRQEYILGTSGWREVEELGRILTCCGRTRFRDFVSISGPLLVEWGLDDQLNSDTSAEEASLFMQGP